MDILQREAAREAVNKCARDLEASRVRRDTDGEAARLAEIHSRVAFGGSMASFVAEIAAAFGGQGTGKDGEEAEVAFAVLPDGDLWVGSDTLLVSDSKHLTPFCVRTPHTSGRRGGVKHGFDAAFWLSDAPHVVTEALSFQFDLSLDGLWGYLVPRWREPSLMRRPPKAIVEAMLSSPPRTEIYIPLRDPGDPELPPITDADIIMPEGLRGLSMWHHKRDEVFRVTARHINGGRWVEVRGGVWYDAAAEANIRQERGMRAKEKRKMETAISHAELENVAYDDGKLRRTFSGRTASIMSDKAMEDEAKVVKNDMIIAEMRRMLLFVEETERTQQASIFDGVRRYWVQRDHEGSAVAIPAYDLHPATCRVYSHPCCPVPTTSSPPGLSFIIKADWGAPRGVPSCAECLAKCFAGGPCKEVSLLLSRTFVPSQLDGIAGEVASAAMRILRDAECVLCEGGGMCAPSRAVLRPEGLPEEVLSSSELDQALGLRLGDPSQLRGLTPDAAEGLGMRKGGIMLAVSALSALHSAAPDRRRRELLARGPRWFASVFKYLSRAVSSEGDAAEKAISECSIVPVWGAGNRSGDPVKMLLARPGGRVLVRPGLEEEGGWALRVIADSGAGQVAVCGAGGWDDSEGGGGDGEGWGPEAESLLQRLGARVGGGWGMAAWLLGDAGDGAEVKGDAEARVGVAIMACSVMGGTPLSGKVLVEARDGSKVAVEELAVSSVFGISCPWCPPSKEFAVMPCYPAPPEERSSGDAWWEAGLVGLGAKPHLTKCCRAWWWACLAEGWGGQCPICIEDLTAAPAQPKGADEGVEAEEGADKCANGHGGVVMLRGCRHAYHERCIERWLVRCDEEGGGGARCPMCREQVPTGAGGRDPTCHMERPSEGAKAHRERLKASVAAAQASTGWGKGGWAALAAEEGGAHIIQRIGGE